MMHQQVEMHKGNQEIAETAMCNEQNVKYCTDPHRPLSHMSFHMQTQCIISQLTCGSTCIGNPIRTLQDKQSRHV